MNFSKHGEELPQFQMTAMMDVVFLLLCFFITSTVFSQWEYEVDLTLPTAKSAQTPVRMPGEIILNIAADGTVTVNQRVFAGEDLDRLLRQVAGYLPGQPIIIRADRGTPYEHFMKVADACRLAGISNLSLATAGESENAPEASSVLPPPPAAELRGGF